MFARGVIILLCVLVAVSDGERNPKAKPNSPIMCTTIYEPVCGSDGKTYSNECELNAANKASKNKIVIVKQGECDQPQQPDCKPYPSNGCPEIYAPVCGSDGKTYGNECELCAANKVSKPKILIVKQGECDQPQQPNCKPYPSNGCPEIYKPVCGSDGKTYGNECELCAANKASKTNILIVKQGECDRPLQPKVKPNSPFMCTMIYKPVCGSDGKTYGSECALNAANQVSKPKIVIVKQGECDQPRQPKVKPNSPFMCTMIYEPVCGSDGKTYGNECMLNAANQASKNKIVIVKQGECDQPQQPDCKPYPSNGCPEIYAPVCGSDGKTYGNECELCAANKVSKPNILIVKQGECDQPQQPNCKPNPSNICTKIYKPVCGSDGKTYNNECLLCVANQASKTKILIQKQGECDKRLPA